MKQICLLDTKNRARYIAKAEVGKVYHSGLPVLSSSSSKRMPDGLLVMMSDGIDSMVSWQMYAYSGMRPSTKVL